MTSLPFRLIPMRQDLSGSRLGFLVALLILTAACGGGQEPAAPALPEASVAQGLVQLDRATADSLSIQTYTVSAAAGIYEFSLPGEVLPAPEAFAVVSAPTGGRVAEINAHEGEAVSRGQIVLQLESAEFAEMAAGYLEARADVDYYRNQAARAASLVEQKVSPQSALEKANAELARAEARVSAAFSRLRALDVPEARIEAWQTTTRERPLLPVYAPISGFIDRHEVDLGTSVNAYQEMLSIVDPREVLVRGFLSPDDAARVRPGSPVVIEQRAGSSQFTEARITTIQPALDEENRSLVINILTPARDGWPVPGQTVRLRIQATSEQGIIRIPTDAIVYNGDRAGVFVLDSADRWRLTEIVLDRLTDNEAFVVSGLREGDRLAVTQVFALKALARFGDYAEE